MARVIPQTLLQQFTNQVTKLLHNEIQEIRVKMGKGSPRSWDEYTEELGKIKGIELSINLLSTVITRMEVVEQDDGEDDV